MSKLKNIPVIDLFAGPGGLGEGFSSVVNGKNRIFDIKLSIEKDENAHKTLQLRSFSRQFPVNRLPEKYYDVLHASNLKNREKLTRELFEAYPSQAKKAKAETWHAELGGKNFPKRTVDRRIEQELKGNKNWVLIGGPPCQAYSLVGRSRVGGIGKDDHRVYLYKEYLRIIARHHPAIFVMENVKGLLSAELNGEKIFDWIKKDLKKPGRTFRGYKSPEYNIYSLVSETIKNDSDFLIKSENYGVPQKRHRVILLGVRKDIKYKPEVLQIKHNRITLKEIIGQLPRIRSGINREYLGFETVFKDGKDKKKRLYKKINDTAENWEKLVTGFRNEILSWNGFDRVKHKRKYKCPPSGTGSEFVSYHEPINKENYLYEWFHDKKLNGFANHESRSHLSQDLKRYLFASIYSKKYGKSPKLSDYERYNKELLPDHKNAKSGKFSDRFRVQLSGEPATTVTSHISKDGHYFIHYDPTQCRSLTVREAARIQTFPDNYLFCGSRTKQYHQVGNAVPPYLAYQIGKIIKNIFNSMK
ncbi:MAG: DNA cytosine methyltransferase [Candidatus Scalindua sp.]|jgi:DNA (cytosine-5)-methyltransferase 1|nr:DNA cytosine methyltransferase [Candidatus Scalindua sp.]